MVGAAEWVFPQPALRPGPWEGGKVRVQFCPLVRACSRDLAAGWEVGAHGGPPLRVGASVSGEDVCVGEFGAELFSEGQGLWPCTAVS